MMNQIRGALGWRVPGRLQSVLLAGLGMFIATAGFLVIRGWNDSLDPFVGTAREALRERR